MGSLTSVRSTVRRDEVAHRHEESVHPAVVGELGVEGDGEDVASRDRDRMAPDLRQHLDARPAILDPGRPDEDRAERLLPSPSITRSSSKLCSWRPKAFRRQM